MIPGLGTRMGSTLLTARYCDIKQTTKLLTFGLLVRLQLAKRFDRRLLKCYS